MRRLGDGARHVRRDSRVTLLVVELDGDVLAGDGARHVRGDGRVALLVDEGGGGGDLLGLGESDGGHFDGVRECGGVGRKSERAVVKEKRRGEEANAAVLRAEPAPLDPTKAPASLCRRVLVL